jgi:hypothetical protein
MQKLGAYISDVAKTAFLGLRVTPELKKQIEEISAREERSMSQICEMLLRAGVESYERSGSKGLRRSPTGAQRERDPKR